MMNWTILVGRFLPIPVDVDVTDDSDLHPGGHRPSCPRSICHQICFDFVSKMTIDIVRSHVVADMVYHCTRHIHGRGILGHGVYSWDNGRMMKGVGSTLEVSMQMREVEDME